MTFRCTLKVHYVTVLLGNYTVNYISVKTTPQNTSLFFSVNKYKCKHMGLKYI